MQKISPEVKKKIKKWKIVNVYLGLASIDHKTMFERILNETRTWAGLQLAFLSMMKKYLERELQKDVDLSISSHEAGGQWRVAFPMFEIRPDRKIEDCLGETVAKRVEWEASNPKQYHGFNHCAEVHHEIENFIYFKIPMFYAGKSGFKCALQSIEDLAHHVGNWVSGIPDWYDWEKHGFVSTWLGTKEVRDYPPNDYQEGNHWRFVKAVTAAYLGTGESCYLDLVRDYADRWSEHIEEYSRQGGPIPCSILSADRAGKELKRGGRIDQADKEYRVFYSRVALNTGGDILGGLMDAYRMTGNERYLSVCRSLVDQFFENGRDGRPALSHMDGEWVIMEPFNALNVQEFYKIHVNGSVLADFAVKHDILTGRDDYRERILAWAKTIDEDAVPADQMVACLMMAAHFYDGNTEWLKRAYQMALRTIAVLEHDDFYHQCTMKRQGSKAAMMCLFQPMLGAVDWGTNGGIPMRSLSHRMSRRGGLPRSVAFRTWRIDSCTDGFEAVNAGNRTARWKIDGISLERNLKSLKIKGVAGPVKEIALGAGETVSGRIRWSIPKDVPLVRPGMF